LNHEQAGSLVAQVLKEDFEFISKEVAELIHKRDKLERHQMEDLSNNVEMRDAMKSLLRYYLTHNDYTEFMELQRVYGNVE
jgi:hypothetical protein